MLNINELEQRLKQISQLMSKGAVNRSLLLLKQLEKTVRSFLERPETSGRDILTEIQIMIYNNLACVFEKKGKYKSSLYHLEVAQKIEADYLAQKYNGKQMPDIALQQLSTTYSNISAVQSKLAEFKPALRNIALAIEILKKSQDPCSQAGFIYLYYNYAVLLEGNLQYSEASRYALEGLERASNKSEDLMVEKYNELLKRLRKQIARQQLRKEKEISRYTKGQIGVFKKPEQISLKADAPQQQKERSKKFWIYTVDKTKRSLSKDNNKTKSKEKDRSSFYRPSQARSSSRKVYSLLALDGVSSAKIKHNTMMEYTNSSHTYFQSNRNRTNHGVIETYLPAEKKTKAYSSHWERTIDARLKERRRKLEKQIQNLGQKNEALEKVIEKMYTTSKQAS